MNHLPNMGKEVNMTEWKYKSKNLNLSEQEKADGSRARVMLYLSTIAKLPKEATNFLVAEIQFQAGPVAEVGVNGVQIEDIIDLLVARLRGFQSGKLSCRDNALAMTKLEEAKHWLLNRTKKRITQGVEGRTAAHKD